MYSENPQIPSSIHLKYPLNYFSHINKHEFCAANFIHTLNQCVSAYVKAHQQEFKQCDNEQRKNFESMEKMEDDCLPYEIQQFAITTKKSKGMR